MIKTDIFVPEKYCESDIKSALAESLPIEKSEILGLRILKDTLSVDKNKGVFRRLSVGVSFSSEREAGLLKMKKKVFAAPEYNLVIPKSQMKSRPVIVGSGPAGLFCALVLAEAGAKPIVLERGLNVDERIKKVSVFEKMGILDPECNIQFGEGGAGTYSDGKLKVGGMDEKKYYVLSEFVAAGADENITYSTSAHLGTDRLSSIVKNLRNKAVSLGAEFIFGAKLVDIKIENGAVKAAIYEKDSEKFSISADVLILAQGHSARDTFQMLFKKGVLMQPKGFGVGMRIEHPREYINRLVYGNSHAPELPTASYHLVTHLPSGRSVYSFCMCPGGIVVAAASSEGGVVTNGMSEHSRMGENSNAAILVSVSSEDFGSESPLAGLEYQRKIEELAFLSAGSDYKAPAVALGELCEGALTLPENAVKPTYPRGVAHVSLKEYLPDYITESLKAGFADFDKWLPGYYLPEAALTGPETRTTSPVRIMREENFESSSLRGLYPIGEGAGYSGGIVSSAYDGVGCALTVIQSVHN